MENSCASQMLIPIHLGPFPGPPPPSLDPVEEAGEGEEEEEKEESCQYSLDTLLDMFEIPDSDGQVVSDFTSADSASGGSVGLGGVDGSGVGYLSDDGASAVVIGPGGGNTPSPVADKFPYPTVSDFDKDNSMLCCRDYPKAGHSGMLPDSWDVVLEKLCSQPHSIGPEEGLRSVQEQVEVFRSMIKFTTTARISWAEDQTGSDSVGTLFTFSGNDFIAPLCYVPLRHIVLNCKYHTWPRIVLALTMSDSS